MTDDRRDEDAPPVPVDPPRVLSHETFQFNFRVSTAARVKAMHGAPSWSRRKKRLDDRLERFWREQDDHAAKLWIAAGEGRIGVDGREIRQALLDGEGRDPIAARERRKELFKARVDRDEAQIAEFNRAWEAYLGRLTLGDLARRIEDFNKYFPIEANLPTDPDTETYVWMGRAWQPAEAPDAAAVLARIPYR